MTAECHQTLQSSFCNCRGGGDFCKVLTTQEHSSPRGVCYSLLTTQKLKGMWFCIQMKISAEVSKLHYIGSSLKPSKKQKGCRKHQKQEFMFETKDVVITTLKYASGYLFSRV